MTYKNRSKQKQKKNAKRQEHLAMFQRRRDNAKTESVIPFEALPILLNLASNRDTNKWELEDHDLHGELD